MNTDNHSDPPASLLPEGSREIFHRAEDAAKEAARFAATTVKEAAGALEDSAGEVVCHARDAAVRATDRAKDMLHTAAVKAGDTLTTSKDYVSRHPVPVVLGAIAVGAALGYLLIAARRRPTFGERYADEPLLAVREAILGAFAPVTHRVHEGYDSAREGAARAVDRLHCLRSGNSHRSLSDRIGNFGSNLKFW